jgi:heme/copper-type cytochrome/quinol oxidase subunit 4
VDEIKCLCSKSIIRWLERAKNTPIGGIAIIQSTFKYFTCFIDMATHQSQGWSQMAMTAIALVLTALHIVLCLDPLAMATVRDREEI